VIHQEVDVVDSEEAAEDSVVDEEVTEADMISMVEDTISTTVDTAVVTREVIKADMATMVVDMTNTAAVVVAVTTRAAQHMVVDMAVAMTSNNTETPDMVLEMINTR